MYLLAKALVRTDYERFEALVDGKGRVGGEVEVVKE